MTRKRISVRRALSFVLLYSLILAVQIKLFNTTVLANSTPQMQWGSLPIGGGGYVTSIITGQNTMYLRTDVGGAYRYEDDRWVQMLWWVNEDDKGYYGVDGIAIDPKNDNIVYLLCGTEYFSGGRTVVMKSTDGGRTFTIANVTNLISAHGNGRGRGNGERIAVDPTNSDIIYAGGRNNVLIKSTNGGSTWSAVTPTGVTTSNGVGFNSVSVDRNGVVYVTASRTGSTNAYKSTDGGATWSALSATLPTNLFPNRTKINPEGNLLLTYTGSACNANDGTPGTGARQFIYNTTTNVVTEIFVRTGTTGESQPVYEISWHPTDPQKLVAVTTGQYRQQRWQGATGDVWGDHIYRSTNGGKTWQQVSMTDMNKAGITWISGAMHWASSIAINPANPDQIHAVSGNGIFASDNIWAGTPQIYFRPAGVEETVPLDFVSVPGGANYSAIGDYDGFKHTTLTTYAPVHTPMLPKNATGIAYNPHNKDVLMRVGEYRDNAAMAYYSTNAGTTWTQMPKIPGTVGDGKCAITTVKGNNRFLWSPGSTSNVTSYYSDNNGATWTAITGLESRRMYFQVDSVNPLIVYAAGNASIYRSTDGGANFTRLGGLTGAVTAMNEIRIAHAPGIEGKLYYPASNGLNVSTNGGKTWTQLPGVTYAAAVGLGKGVTESSPHAIYIWGNVGASSTRGIYRSIDDGQTWVRINDDQHQFGGTGNANLISGDMNVYGRVYMSTVGMGVIYGDLISDSGPAVSASVTWVIQDSGWSQPEIPVNIPYITTGIGTAAASYTWDGSGATGLKNLGYFLLDATLAPITARIDSIVVNGTTLTAGAHYSNNAPTLSVSQEGNNALPNIWGLGGNTAQIYSNGTSYLSYVAETDEIRFHLNGKPVNITSITYNFTFIN